MSGEIVVSNFTRVTETHTTSGKPILAKAICSVHVDGYTLNRMAIIDDGKRAPFISLPRGKDYVTGEFFQIYTDNDPARWRAISKAVLDLTLTPSSRAGFWPPASSPPMQQDRLNTLSQPLGRLRRFPYKLGFALYFNSEVL